MEKIYRCEKYPHLGIGPLRFHYGVLIVKTEEHERWVERSSYAADIEGTALHERIYGAPVVEEPHPSSRKPKPQASTAPPAPRVVNTDTLKAQTIPDRSALLKLEASELEALALAHGVEKSDKTGNARKFAYINALAALKA